MIGCACSVYERPTNLLIVEATAIEFGCSAPRPDGIRTQHTGHPENAGQSRPLARI
jgi:hypothetical protein